MCWADSGPGIVTVFIGDLRGVDSIRVGSVDARLGGCE